MSDTTKSLIGVLVIGLILSGVVGLAVVKTYSGNGAPQNVAENGGIINVYNQIKESLVGARSADPTNLDTGEWTQWNDGAFDDVEISDDLFVTGDVTFNGGIAMDSGDAFERGSYTEYVTTGGFADATTTLFCVANPNAATSTVEVILQVTAPSTSTVNLWVTTSTVSSIATPVAPNVNLNQANDTYLITAELVTSTLAYIHSGVKLLGADGGLSAGVSSTMKMGVGPSEYVCGTVGGSITGGVTGLNNTFGGSYKLIFGY